jgi:hypothetical protein
MTRSGPPCGGGEHEGLRVARAGQVGGQLVNDGPGQPDRAAACAGLGRPEPQHAPDLGDDLRDLDRPPEQVDATTAQAGQLPDAQAAIAGDQDQGAVARGDHVGQPGGLGWVRNRISSRSTLGSGTRRHGVCMTIPASTAAAMTLPRSW